MKPFFVVVFFIVALVPDALGASVATENSKDHNCTLGDGFKALSCVFKMQDFLEKVEHLNTDNKNETANLKRSCDNLEKCFTALDCQTSPEDKQASDISAMIKTYCDTIVYISTDFAGCSEKLEDKNSQCFEDWDPFPDDINKEKDEKKREEKKKEACKNFFGKDNCLKEEIIKTCSEVEWNGFENHFTSLGNITRLCDFDKI